MTEPVRPDPSLADDRERDGVASLQESPTQRDIEQAQWCLDVLRGLWTDRCPTSGRNGASSPRPTFGRFTILDGLGSGGQGVVFKAHDPLLNRDVALKIARPETLATPELEARFLAEAHALAALEHPNLVTIYEAGRVGPALYLATALCRGPTLADWLREAPGPVDIRTAAAIVASLAETVQYLHDRGVLHRDLKPQNVLLDPIGTEPHAGLVEQPGDAADLLSRYALRLTDFGLAQMPNREHSTVSGTVLGTPAYMAPEQCRGRRDDIGPPTDVYALGVILYELVTGRPPFRGDSPLQTVDLVTGGRPVVPRSHRQDVPRDLEAICLKCLDAEPQARYRTARELGADLGRHLRGESVLARPAGRLAGLVKTCRRRPVATGMGAALAVLALAAAGMWRQSVVQKHRAEMAARQSYVGLQRIYDAMEADGRWDVPDMQPYRREFIEIALQEYRALRNQTGFVPELDAEIAHGAYRAAGIAAIQGEHADAVALFDEAIELFNSLAETQSENFEHRLFVAKCTRERGLCRVALDERDRAERELARAVDMLLELAEEQPRHRKTQFELAVAEYDLATRRHFDGRSDAARPLLDRARPHLEALTAAHPGGTIEMRYLAATWLLESRLDLAEGRTEEAWEAGQKAHEIQRRLVESDRDPPWSVRDLAKTERQLAVVAQHRGDDDESLSRLESATAIVNGLVNRYPTAWVFREDRCDDVRVRIQIARHLQSMGRHSDAKALFEEAVRAGRSVVTHNSERRHDDANNSADELLIRCYLGVAQCEFSLENPDGALAASLEVVTLLAPEPRDAALALYLGTAWEYCGRTYHLRGRLSDALLACERSYALRLQLRASRPEDRALLGGLVRVCRRAEDLCRACDRTREAEAWARRAAALEGASV